MFPNGTDVAFAGSAADAEEGDLSADLVWTSSRDGLLGTGAAFATAGLACGLHQITASVVDLHGGSDQQTIQIQIGPEGCPAYPQSCGLGPELAAVLALLGLARLRRA